MRAVLGCVALFALSAGLTFGAAGQEKKDDKKKDEPKKKEEPKKDDKVEKIDPKKLVGKWEPADAKKIPPMVLEFTADNKVTLSVGEAKAAGTYALAGDRLEVSLKQGADELKQTLVVRKLTDDELTTEDEKKKTETLRRLKK